MLFVIFKTFCTNLYLVFFASLQMQLPPNSKLLWMQNACMAVAMCDVNAARILLSQQDKQPKKKPTNIAKEPLVFRLIRLKRQC